jgi:nicotinamide riboside kinase
MEKTKTRFPTVYIIGAQCTGKTTLVDQLEKDVNDQDSSSLEKQQYKPVIIREVARRVLRERGFSRHDISNSPARAGRLQELILEAQWKIETSLCESVDSQSYYMSDRSGLDPIVYARVFAEKDTAYNMLASKEWQELEGRMRAGIVVLCEAGCSWLQDDGTRLMPDGLESWMRIDVAFRDLLDTCKIDYVVCPKDVTDLLDRVQFVLQQLALRCS